MTQWVESSKRVAFSTLPREILNIFINFLLFIYRAQVYWLAAKPEGQARLVVVHTSKQYKNLQTQIKLTVH